ncbi:8TM microsporidial transmembrane domain-containing protein [Encephalitozoon hellem]|nr:8TM microsporidial transmembrane domain-containing protein [Encephalitozoon hellem]
MSPRGLLKEDVISFVIGLLSTYGVILDFLDFTPIKMPRITKALTYVLVLALRFYDIPSFCYNYYNPESCYQQEFLKPSAIPTIYQIIPRRCFVYISAICDFIVSRLVNSEKYFIYSSFLPADVISIENLLVVLEKHEKDITSFLLTHLSVFYAPLLTSASSYALSYIYPAYKKDHENAHKPSLSVTWFFHLNIFPQYSRYFYDIFYALMVYIFSIVPEEQKMEIILLFKPSNYKSYLLYIADSPLLHFYLLIFLLENYIQYLFRIHGIGNPNFLNWSYLAFTCLFILERRWRILMPQKPHSEKNQEKASSGLLQP